MNEKETTTSAQRQGSNAASNSGQARNKPCILSEDRSGEDRTGDFVIWDALEDITGIHQRILREIEEKTSLQSKNP